MSSDKFKLIPAAYLVLRRNDEVLLLQRANTGYQDGNYSVIAGHIDGDELATHAIAREAAEEAGIVVDPADIEFAHVVHRLNRDRPNEERIDLFFEARKWQGEVTNAEPEKCDDLSWYPVGNLPVNMLPLVRHVIQAVGQGIRYSEYTHEPVNN